MKKAKLAYLFGTPDYDQPAFSPLPVVHRDIELMTTLLEFNDYKTRVKKGLGRSDLSAELRGCIRDAPSCDKLIVYFSGHGMHVRGKDYIVPRDGRTDDAERYEEYFVSTDISSVAVESKAKSILFLVDACREGLSLRSKGLQLANWGKKRISRLEDKELTVLYSCKSGQLSHHTSEGSVFTRGLFESLNEAEHPLTLEELLEALDDRMRTICSDNSLPRHGPRVLTETASSNSVHKQVFFPNVARGAFAISKTDSSEASSSKDSKNLAKQTLMSLTTQAFGAPDALNETTEITPNRRLLSRSNIIQSIAEELDGGKGVLLVGPPGSGKTTLLNQLSETKSRVVYISIKNRTLGQVAYGLHRQLGTFSGTAPCRGTSELELLLSLEEQSIESEAIYLLDDCSSNTGIVDRLSAIPSIIQRGVFCSRVALNIPGVARLNVPPLTREEIETFVQLRDKKLSAAKFEALVTQSAGNPLYLHYYLTATLANPPESLHDYQSSILDSLSESAFDLVNLIAQSETCLPLSELVACFRAELPPSKIRGLTAELGEIVEQDSAGLSLFHSSFSAFVRQEAQKLGYSNIFLRLLANGLRDSKPAYSTLYATRCGIEVNAEKVFAASDFFANRLDWAKVNELLEPMLVVFDKPADSDVRGMLYVGLAESSRETSLPEKANELIANARTELALSEDSQVVAAFAMYDALISLDSGDFQSIETLERLVSETDPSDEEFKAVLLSNISYAYLKLGRAVEGVKAAEQSAELFEHLGLTRGLNNALSNLSACIGQLESFSGAELFKHAKGLIERAKQQSNNRLSAIGYNHLAKAYRKLNQPDKAEHASRMAIKFCQLANVLEMELSNIANLGNALLDQKRFNEAEELYLEALSRGQAARFPRVILHANELLGKLYLYIENDYAKALPFLESATEAAREFGDKHREATSGLKLAEAYRRAARLEDAAAAFEKSGRGHSLFEDWGEVADGLHQAAEIRHQLGESEYANRLAIESAKAALINMEPGTANNSLLNLVGEPDSAIPIYSQIIRQYGEVSEVENFIPVVLNYVSDCRRAEQPTQAWSQFVDDFVGLAKTKDAVRKPQILRALAFALIQYSLLHPIGDFALTVMDAVGPDAGFRYYVDDFDVETADVRLFSERLLLRIECLSENTFVIGMLSAMVLLVGSNFTELEQAILENGGPRERFLRMLLFDEAMAMNIGIPPLPSYGPQSCQCTFSESAVPFGEPQPETNVIFHTQFSSMLLTSESLASVRWLLMNFYRVVVGHFSWTPNGKISAKKAGLYSDTILLRPPT